MLRQIRRLTRCVPLAGPNAVALATYAEPPAQAISRTNTGLILRTAAERGFEGVACVDDAARAALLLCRVWRTHRLIWAREEACGYLQFLLYMQQDDGRFANFILDWNGEKNLAGPTSVPGGPQWQARALRATAAAAAAFENEPRGDVYAESFLRGLAWLQDPPVYLDTGAESVLALLEAQHARHLRDHQEVAGQALAWADEIASHTLGGVVPNAAGQIHDVHLWGHLQEAALARVGAVFGRPDLVNVARTSADRLLAPAVAGAFDAPWTLPFDVSAASAGLAAVAEATGEQRYAVLAQQARAWFHGRNAAHRPVYDRRLGLVYDGIDHGRVSQNSGAESNLEGALALFDELPWSAQLPW